MNMKKINIFTFLNQIFYKKANEPYDKKVASAYMLSLWLSHDYSIIDIVNKINPYIFSLKDELIYKYFFHKIPKKKRFIKWIKKEETSKTKAIKDEVDSMRNYYGISKREANLYKKLLEKPSNAR